MNKFSKIFLSLALVLILALPMFTGCSLFGNNNNTNKASIEIHTSFKTEYEIGDSIDLTNGKIKYTDKEGIEHIVEIKQNMISSFSTDTAGTRQMIITYEGCDKLVDYTVYADVKVGDLFYANPSPTIERDENHDPNDWYQYVKFLDNNVIVFVSDTTNPDTFNQTDFSVDFKYAKLSSTKAKENGKVVYTIDNEYVLFKITVLTTNKIHVEGGYKGYTSYSFDLVKYIVE